jgi:hypothetical protein
MLPRVKAFVCYDLLLGCVVACWLCYTICIFMNDIFVSRVSSLWQLSYHLLANPECMAGRLLCSTLPKNPAGNFPRS